jgi:hypothetical protein
MYIFYIPKILKTKNLPKNLPKDSIGIFSAGMIKRFRDQCDASESNVTDSEPCAATFSAPVNEKNFNIFFRPFEEMEDSFLCVAEEQKLFSRGHLPRGQCYAHYFGRIGRKNDNFLM